MADAPSFLIADDHPMVRDALASALGQAFSGAAIAMAGTFAEVQVELEREPEVDALLLDLDMPGMDGLTGLALLRSDHPAVPIIIVSAAREPATIRRAYEFGASAYIDKSASLDEIARIVRAVLAGEIFAPPEAGARRFLRPARRPAHAAAMARAGADGAGRPEQADRPQARRRRGHGEGACHGDPAQARRALAHPGGDRSARSRTSPQPEPVRP